MGARSFVTFAIAGALLAVGAIAATGGANHDEPDCKITDPPGEVIAVGPDPAGNQTYINVREQPGSVYIYLESNGVAGLQTGDANPTQDAVGIGYTDAGHQSLCGHEPDTLIF